MTSFITGDPAITAAEPIIATWDGTAAAKTVTTGFTVGPNPVAPLGLPFSGDVSLPDATVGKSYVYEENTVAVGTATPVSYSISSGSLPPGLSLSTVGNDWKISGTPTTPGTYGFTLQATNSVGSTNVSLSITVNVAGGEHSYTFMG